MVALEIGLAAWILQLPPAYQRLPAQRLLRDVEIEVDIKELRRLGLAHQIIAEQLGTANGSGVLKVPNPRARPAGRRDEGKEAATLRRLEPSGSTKSLVSVVAKAS